MMNSIFLELPDETRTELWDHLLPPEKAEEQAAFIYARWEQSSIGGVFHFVESLLVPPEGFVTQSEYYIELTDEIRASAIKRAHDLQVSLIEVHSHRGHWPAEFSPSDLLGFSEFVPHVWWRLKRKPYLAIVVAKDSLDGIAWIDDPNSPRRLSGVITEGKVVAATGLSDLEHNSHGI